MKNYKEIVHNILKLDSKKIKIVNYEDEWKTLFFTIKGINRYAECPTCKCKTDKKQDRWEYLQKPTWKHIYLSDNRMIELRLIRRYFRCYKCWSQFMEKFDFEAKQWNHTKKFEDDVMVARWYMSGCQIARNTQCSPQKIHQILHNIDPEAINKQWLELMKSLEQIFLGIDEHSFHGRDYVLVITEIKERKPLAVLSDNKIETLKKWLKSLPNEVKDKITWISTDMNKWYKNVVEWEHPNVLSTVDKYHLFQEANRMMDDVRGMNTWLIKMWFITPDDLVKYGKVPKELMKGKKNQKEKGD